MEDSVQVDHTLVVLDTVVPPVESIRDEQRTPHCRAATSDLVFCSSSQKHLPGVLPKARVEGINADMGTSPTGPTVTVRMKNENPFFPVFKR